LSESCTLKSVKKGKDLISDFGFHILSDLFTNYLLEAAGTLTFGLTELCTYCSSFWVDVVSSI